MDVSRSGAREPLRNDYPDAPGYVPATAQPAEGQVELAHIDGTDANSDYVTPGSRVAREAPVVGVRSIGAKVVGISWSCGVPFAGGDNDYVYHPNDSHASGSSMMANLPA